MSDPEQTLKKILLTAGLTTAASSSGAVQTTAYRALSFAAAVGTGLATRSLLTRLWTEAAGEPPRDPSDPDVDWRDALTWAAAAGIGVGVGRVVGRRLAAGAWERATGEPAPPTG